MNIWRSTLPMPWPEGRDHSNFGNCLTDSRGCCTRGDSFHLSSFDKDVLGECNNILMTPEYERKNACNCVQCVDASKIQYRIKVMIWEIKSFVGIVLIFSPKLSSAASMLCIMQICCVVWHALDWSAGKTVWKPCRGWRWMKQIAWVNGDRSMILYMLDRVDKFRKYELLDGGTMDIHPARKTIRIHCRNPQCLDVQIENVFSATQLCSPRDFQNAFVAL